MKKAWLLLMMVAVCQLAAGSWQLARAALPGVKPVPQVKADGDVALLPADHAPVVVVDGKYHGDVKVSGIKKLIKVN